MEDFGLRIAGLRFEGVVAEAVEVPAEGEIVFTPDAAQRPNELLGAAVSLIMVKPRLADRCEFPAKPTADDIHGDAAVIELIECGDLFRCYGGIPRPRQQSRDHLETLSGLKQSLAESHRLVLELSAVARRKANLAQRIIKTVLLGDLGELPVVIDVVACPLFDLADH